MPVPPKPIDRGGLIDPRRNGDDRAYKAPTHDHRGKPITERRWTSPGGRHIPPSRDHITIINNTTIINNINHVHRDWNRNDHSYRWYDWDGRRTYHHYDTFGFHWWGFYVGGVYFETRYHHDRFWWYDPYWHRWVYLHDNRWWWQDPITPTVTYVIIDNSYQRYQENAGTIIVRPDPTPPVVTPPAEPAQPNVPAPAPQQPDQETMYSLDGTRSIQILSERREAYLYDLTAKDPNSADARGRWLGTGVKSAKFVYDDKHEADGSTTQVLRQIELTFDNPKVKASVDLEGERKVVVAGDDRVAYLYDLKNEDVEEKFLASRVSEIKLVNSESTDASGNVTRKLKLVLVTAEDSEGVDSLFLFNRDGGPYESAPAAEVPEEVAPGAIPEAPSVPDAPTAPDAPRASAAERMHQSAAFQTLMSGQLGW